MQFSLIKTSKIQITNVRVSLHQATNKVLTILVRKLLDRIFIAHNLK